MKHIRYIFCLVLFFLCVSARAQEQTPQLLLGVDFISPTQEIEVDPEGETVTLHILANGGFMEETLMESIQAGLEALSIDWITSVYLTNKEGIYEADLNFVVDENDTESMRSLILTASNGSATIKQYSEVQAYSISPSSLTLIHGESKNVILSGSVSGNEYLLVSTPGNDSITMQGTGSALSFTVSEPGLYRCYGISQPHVIEMRDSCLVQWEPFYSSNRNSSLAPNPYRFPKSGGSVTFTYQLQNGEQLSLNRILNSYNGGTNLSWNSHMEITVDQNSFPAASITVSCTENTTGAEIRNDTYFKDLSGNHIVFIQDSWAKTKYSLSLSGSSPSQRLVLSGSEAGVPYLLYRNGVPSGTERTGTGDTLSFPIPTLPGKYHICAEKDSVRVQMNGTLTITEDGTAVIGDNWILKQTYTEANGAASNLDITYYDGLGYPTQIISAGASPSGKNIVTPVWYDPMRRDDAKAYLPYASSSNALSQPETDPYGSQRAFYTSLYGAGPAEYAYAEKVYEPSPLNRVERQYLPGDDFRSGGTYSGNADHFTQFGYQFNSAGEVLDLLCDASGNLLVKGFLPEAKLYKNTTTSPDGRVTVEFKDSDDRTILAASGSGSQTQETYYVYDGRMQLRWVLQPEATARIKALAANASSANPSVFTQSDSTARKFCFIYNYNGKGQMTEKRIPGKGFEYMVYDPAGRLVATQDSTLRLQNRWILTRYDSLSRITSTSVFTGTVSQRTRDQMQGIFDLSPYPAIFGNAGNITLTSATFGEAGNTFSNGNVYSSDIPSYLAFSPVSGVAETADIDSRTASLLLYDKTLNLNTINSSQNLRRYRERAYYYDSKGRVIQTVEKLPDGETLRTSVRYDFTGNPLKTVQTSSRQGQMTLVQTFNYDSRGRKLSSSARMNTSQNPSTNPIAKTFSAVNYTYDGLGRLTGSERGKTAQADSFVLSPSSTSPVLSTSLNYNIQGWMTTQTDVLKKGTSQSDIANLYSQTLRYHDAQKASTTKSYDGLITEWETTQFSNGTDFTLPGSTADRYTYAYSYDSFGRLTESARYAGFSVNPNNIFTEKNLTYDRNGNILTLTRYGNGNATIKDNFIYSYDGNRLKHLAGTADYQYDGNGNMTLDALRNITLTYDINNLVSTVSRNDTLLSTYHYFADGTKYKVIDPDNNGRVYIGPFSYTTAKSGNTVYSYLEGIDTDGGRIMVVRKQSGTQNTYDYTTAFFVRDHLGSTRVMLNAQGDILERNAYYPFGLQMNQGKAYPTLTQRLPQLYSGYVSSAPARRDLYNGKEIQTAAGTDYIDYGFRQYDQTVARWFNIDPKAEKYLTITPFDYCTGNPISLYDLMGNDWYSTTETDSSGNVITKYYFSYTIYSQEDLEKEGIEGTYIGINGFVENNTKYLNLFGGEMQIKDSKSYRNALIIANLDNAIISYYRARYTNRNRPYPNQDFDVGLTDMTLYDVRNDNKKFEITKSQIYAIEYAGGTVFYTTANDLSNSYFDWGTGKYYNIFGSFNLKYNLGSGIIARIRRYYHRFEPVIWIFKDWDSWNNAKERAERILLYRKKPF